MKRQTGFTLIELMVTLAIIGVLASIALPSYQKYILKAKLVEAVLLLDRLKQDVVVNFESSGNLPGQVMGAASSQSINFPDSAMIRDFMYRDTSNKKYTRGWLRVRFENDVIPGCTRNKCAVYTGFIIRNGRLAFYCGHWNAGWSSFPLDLLPQNCREPADSVSYRK